MADTITPTASVRIGDEQSFRLSTETGKADSQHPTTDDFSFHLSGTTKKPNGENSHNTAAPPAAGLEGGDMSFTFGETEPNTNGTTTVAPSAAGSSLQPPPLPEHPADADAGKEWSEEVAASNNVVAEDTTPPAQPISMGDDAQDAQPAAEAKNTNPLEKETQPEADNDDYPDEEAEEPEPLQESEPRAEEKSVLGVDTTEAEQEESELNNNVYPDEEAEEPESSHQEEAEDRRASTSLNGHPSEVEATPPSEHQTPTHQTSLLDPHSESSNEVSPQRDQQGDERKGDHQQGDEQDAEKSTTMTSEQGPPKERVHSAPPLLGHPAISVCISISEHDFDDSMTNNTYHEATTPTSTALGVSVISRGNTNNDPTPFTSLRELEGLLESTWATPASVLDSYVYYYAHEGRVERLLPYRTKSMLSTRGSISAIIMGEETEAAKKRRASPFVRYQDEEADRSALRLKFHSETTTHASEQHGDSPAGSRPKRPFVMPHHPLVRHYLRSPAAGAPIFPPSANRDARAFLQETNFLCRAEDQARHKLQMAILAILKDWIPHRNILKQLNDRDKREKQRLVHKESRVRAFVEEEQEADRAHVRFLSNFDIRKKALAAVGLSVANGEVLEALEKEENGGRGTICDKWARESEKMQDTVDKFLFEALRTEHNRNVSRSNSAGVQSGEEGGGLRVVMLPLSIDALHTTAESPLGTNLFDETILATSPPISKSLDHTATMYGLTHHQSPNAVRAERKVRAGVMNRVSLRQLSKAHREDVAEAHHLWANQVRSESAFVSQQLDDTKQRDHKKNFAHVVKQRDDRKKTRKDFQASQDALQALTRAEARQDYLAYKWDWHAKQNKGESAKVSQLCNKQLWKANVANISQHHTPPPEGADDASAIEFSPMNVSGIDPFLSVNPVVEVSHKEPDSEEEEDDDHSAAPTGRRSLAPLPRQQDRAASKKPSTSGASADSNATRRASADRPATASDASQHRLTPTKRFSLSVHSVSTSGDSTSRPPTRAAKSLSQAPQPHHSKNSNLLPIAHQWQARRTLEIYTHADGKGTHSSLTSSSSASKGTTKLRGSSAIVSKTVETSKAKQQQHGPAHPVDIELAKTALCLNTLLSAKGGVVAVDPSTTGEVSEGLSAPAKEALDRAAKSAKFVRKDNQLFVVDPRQCRFDYEDHIAHLLATCDPQAEASETTYSPLELTACRLLCAQRALHNGDSKLAQRLYLLALKSTSQLDTSVPQTIRTKGGDTVEVSNVDRCKSRLAMLQHKIGGALCRTVGQLQEALKELRQGISVEASHTNNIPTTDEISILSPRSSPRATTSSGTTTPSRQGRVGQLDVDILSLTSTSRPGTSAATPNRTPRGASSCSFGSASRDILPRLLDQYGQLTRLGAAEEQRRKAHIVRELKKAAANAASNGDTPHEVWLAEGGEVATTTNYALTLGNPVLRLNIAAVLTQSGQCAAAVGVGREAVDIITAQLQANTAAVMDAAKAADTGREQQQGSNTLKKAVTILPFPNALELAVTALMALGSAQRGLPLSTTTGAPSERDSAPTTSLIAADLANECLPSGHPLRHRAPTR